MLLYKLTEIESTLSHSEFPDLDQIKTVLSLKRLLLQIDFRAEQISDFSFATIVTLLNHLKGESLSPEEEVLIKNILNDL